MRTILRVALSFSLITGLSMAQHGGGFRGGGGGFAHGGIGGGGFRGGVGIGHGGFVGGGFRTGLAVSGFHGGFGGFYGRGFGYHPAYGYGYYWPYLYSGFGLGYSYWPSYYGYPYGYSYPPYYSSPSPNVTVVYPQSPQSAQTASAEHATPAIHSYDEYGQEVKHSASSGGSPIYLIASRDHVIRAVVAYWVAGSMLHYVTLQHEEKELSLDSVDRDLSAQLNRERHVPFSLATQP